MRRLFLALTALAVLTAPACAGESPAVSRTKHATVGELLLLKLRGNPSAGDKWRLNEEQSKGLDLVAVDQVGWIMAPEAQSIFFQKHSILNVSVMPKAPGRAELAFDRHRTYGRHAMVNTTVIRVVIEPKKTASR